MFRGGRRIQPSGRSFDFRIHHDAGDDLGPEFWFEDDWNLLGHGTLPESIEWKSPPYCDGPSYLGYFGEIAHGRYDFIACGFWSLLFSIHWGEFTFGGE